MTTWAGSHCTLKFRGWDGRARCLHLQSPAARIFPRRSWRLSGKLVGSGCVVAVCDTAFSQCHAGLQVSALAISVLLVRGSPRFRPPHWPCGVVGVVCMRSVSLCSPMGACSQSDKGLQSPQTHFWGPLYSLHMRQFLVACLSPSAVLRRGALGVSQHCPQP